MVSIEITLNHEKRPNSFSLPTGIARREPQLVAVPFDLPRPVKSVDPTATAAPGGDSPDPLLGLGRPAKSVDPTATAAPSGDSPDPLLGLGRPAKSIDPTATGVPGGDVVGTIA
jgi:hypothetical protein